MTAAVYDRVVGESAGLEYLFNRLLSSEARGALTEGLLFDHVLALYEPGLDLRAVQLRLLDVIIPSRAPSLVRWAMVVVARQFEDSPLTLVSLVGAGSAAGQLIPAGEIADILGEGALISGEARGIHGSCYTLMHLLLLTSIMLLGPAVRQRKPEHWFASEAVSAVDLVAGLVRQLNP